MFGSSWDTGEATIVARNTKFTGDGTTATHEYVADIRPAEGAPFRATIHEPTIATDFWPPSIGDVVSVLIKSKDKKVKFDKDDERLSAKAFRTGRDLAFEAAQNQPVGSPVGSTQPWGMGGPAASGALPDAVMAKLAQLGIAPGSPMQVVGRDSAQGQAVLGAFGVSPGAAGVPTAGDMPGAAPTAESRLARIAALHQQGLLTDAEYATQRERIISEL
jgi:hypothetical protein